MQITNSTGTDSTNYSRLQSTDSVNQDSRLKAIQNQIANVQKQLQNLSNNDKMSLEVKTDKRKELQQQLQDLNRQAMQRKIEIQQEKREKAAAASESQDLAPGETEGEKSGVMKTAAMQGIINADTSMKQAKTVRSVKNGMEGKAGVLEGEIKMDKARGGSTEKKEAELAALNDRINTASADMMAQISDIDKALEKSGEAGDEEKKDGAEAVNRGGQLSDPEGEKLSAEIVKNPGSSETIQTESQNNPAQLQSSGNQEKGRYVNIKL